MVVSIFESQKTCVIQFKPLYVDLCSGTRTSEELFPEVTAIINSRQECLQSLILSFVVSKQMDLTYFNSDLVEIHLSPREFDRPSIST